LNYENENGEGFRPDSDLKERKRSRTVKIRNKTIPKSKSSMIISKPVKLR
jgi:hypothetical protein